MKAATATLAFLCMVILSSSARTEDSPTDRWSPVRFLLGSWTGSASGMAGEGSVAREYEFVLRDRYIRETNRSDYPPQDKNPKGEIHEHVGYLSFDKARQLIVLRQFHVEGFVNQYVLSAESTPKRVIFESERFENFSNEWRARETYDLEGPDAFVETFELAAPGKPFEVYSRNRFQRTEE